MNPMRIMVTITPSEVTLGQKSIHIRFLDAALDVFFSKNLFYQKQ